MRASGKRWLATWVGVACIACGGSARTPVAQPTRAAVASGGSAPCATTARKEQQQLREHLPPAASASLILRRNALSFLEDFFAGNPEMTRELAAHFKRTLGVDLSSVLGLTAFAVWPTDPPTAAAFLHLREPGALLGKPFETHRGVGIFASGIDQAMVMASVRDGLWVGTPAGVRRAIDHEKDAANAESTAWPGDGSDVDVAAYTALWTLPDEGIQQVISRFGSRDAILTFDRDRVLTLRVRGSDDRTQQAKQLVDGGIDMAMAGARIALQANLGENEVWSGAGAIVARHQLDKLVDELRPVVEGHDLVSRYHYGDTGQAAVAMLGVSAAIAVPAFATYVRRSKASEAITNVTRIATLVSEHDAALRANAPKSKKRKPAPAARIYLARTPSKVPCADKVMWGDAERSAWSTLGFAPDGGTHYAYEVAPPSELHGAMAAGAELVVRATGDLDCDGTLSTFDVALRRSADGLLVPDGTPAIQNETE